MRMEGVNWAVVDERGKGQEEVDEERARALEEADDYPVVRRVEGK